MVLAGGHTEEDHLGFPYLMGCAKNASKYRFVGDKEIRERVAKKFNILPDEIMRSREMTDNFVNARKAYWEIIEKEDIPETEEYENWQKENDILEQNVQNILDEFYKTKQKETDFYLHLSPVYPGYRVESVGRKKEEEIITKDRKEIEGAIRLAQEEMELFGKFLKQRFFYPNKEGLSSELNKTE